MKSGYFTLQNFKPGLDCRRSELTSVPGVLERMVDCHVNQGGEIEKRKAFVKYVAPMQTFGLDVAPGGLVVFGSGTTPAGAAAWPAFNTTWYNITAAPVSYVQLTSPFLQLTPPGSAMTKVISSAPFEGGLFVVASFGTDGNFAFVVPVGTAGPFLAVPDFYVGSILAGLTTSAEQATSLAASINQTTGYSAVAVGANVTITGKTTDSYTVVANITSAVGSAALTQENIPAPGSAATTPSGSFIIAAGNAGTGFLPYINQIIVNGVTVLNPAIINWTGSAISTALAASTAINNNSGTSGYIAIASGSTVMIYGAAGAIVTPLDISVSVINSGNGDGAIVIQNCSFNFNIPPGGVVTVTNVTSAKVGATIINGPVSILSSAYTTVQLFLLAIAQAINIYTEGAISLYWSCSASGNTLYLSTQVDDGTDTNDSVTITYTAMGGASIGGTPGLTATVSPTRVGVNQVATVTVKGGVSPYTYAWTVSNPVIFISSNASASISFSSPATAGNLVGFATCLVTDSTGAQASVTVTVNLNLGPT